MSRDATSRPAFDRFAVGLLALAAAMAGWAAILVSRHTIDVVQAEQLLPGWDLAGHLLNGWIDADLLKSGRLHRLAWDLWMQGYWPPGHALLQVPFYVLLGGDMSSGLWSSLVAFVLVVTGGTALLWHQWGRGAALPSAFFLAFALGSPFFLAYASVAMVEMPGVLAQTCVLLAWLRYEQGRRVIDAKLLAASLTLLFFTKYNYLILVAAPILVFELARRAAAMDVQARWDRARALVRFLMKPGVVLLALYALAVVLVSVTGGFAFHVASWRVRIGGIGNSGYVVLYLLLGRLWYLHRRGRIDWARLWSADPLLRPLAIWFGVPVLIWLASPYPNHMKDVANLVINAPMGESAINYVDALRDEFFASDWLFAGAAVGFSVAAVRYRRQPPLVQLLIVAAVLQFIMVGLHHTRFVRFLMMPVPLLWLVAASELGTWIRRLGRPVSTVAAIALLGISAFLVQAVVTGDAFRRAAFENYTASPALVRALARIREESGPGGRVAVFGRSAALSPSLMGWYLGPPSGGRAFPVDVTRQGDVDELGSSTHALLIVPSGPDASTEIVADYARNVEWLRPWIEDGRFVPTWDQPVEDLHVTLRLHRRLVRGNEPDSPPRE